MDETILERGRVRRVLDPDRCQTAVFRSAHTTRTIRPRRTVEIFPVALIGFRGLRLPHCPRSAPPDGRPLKKKDFKEERVTTIGLYTIGPCTVTVDRRIAPPPAA